MNDDDKQKIYKDKEINKIEIVDDDIKSTALHNEEELFKKRLEELRRRDPFIYR